MCRSYANFCNCGKQLDKRLEALQGQRFADRLDVHREDLPAIDRWLATLTKALGSLQLKPVAQSGGELPKACCVVLPQCQGSPRGGTPVHEKHALCV